MPISVNENGTIKSLSVKMTGLGIEGIERIGEFINTTLVANRTFDNVPLGRPLNEYKYLLILPSYIARYDPGTSQQNLYTLTALMPICIMHYSNTAPHYTMKFINSGASNVVTTISAEDMTSTTITVAMSNLSNRNVGMILDGIY